MSTLILQAADKVVGGLVGSAASMLGRAASGLLGASSGGDRIRFTEGPRLSEMQGLSSQEGAPIPRLYGRARLGGQLIWATRFEEVVTTSVGVERTGGRGGKSLGGSPRRTTISTGYSYFANLAIGLCEGPIGFVRRVWADGREVDLTTLSFRVHRGEEDQEPDPLVVAKEGAENAPAYRGLAYVVFERLPLAPYGNRVPQFSFEVVRPVGTLGPAIRSVCLIPGATEFGYDPRPVARVLGLGASAPENVHQFARPSDVLASLDALQALCPNLSHVAVVASWFGTDLRAGHCRIEPRVDLAAKATSGGQWSVAGLSRLTAAETSRAGGSAAYGGTPSDDGLVRLIGELKARGLAVTLYPFVMMDVPPGNALPDPHGGAEQAAYPWRGRITCHPAPGRPGTPDATPAAAAEIAAFFGEASPAHYATSGGAVTYAGPEDWSFRRLVLHYAALAAAAGGVDAFVIGSEFVGLTRVRSAPGDGAWLAVEPRIGFLAYVADEHLLYVRTEGGWTALTDALTAIQDLGRLGLGTQADAENPFAAKLNKALWTARGTGEGGTGDLRYTLNKQASANVLSLLMQTGYSGRFEFGLVGSDTLSAKVSADGVTWHQAMTLDGATGALDFRSPEASLASAATVDLGSSPGRRVVVTGTTSITSLGSAPCRERLVRFAGALTLVHDAATLNLANGGANIVTAAGDTASVVSDASGNWRLVHYWSARGGVLFTGAHTASNPDAAGMGFTSGDTTSITGTLRGFHYLTAIRNNTDFGVQLAISDGAEYIGVRRRSIGTWQGWRQLAEQGAAATFAGVTSSALVQPSADNTIALGASGRRWSVVYSGTGTINTSDAREKTAVDDLTEAEIGWARDLAAGIGRYRYLAAILEKGEGARLHVGLSVQRAIELGQARGLDPFRYAFICRDELPAEAEGDGGLARERYGFRLDQLALFLTRGQEARLAALETASAG